ncbi:MAG: site-2 protease family protein [Planctomycetota bacterium]|nr:site-2 protease family protein [Planctomycetota bacterium]
MVNDEIMIGIAMIVSLAIALSLHEWAHALVATWRGDTTARDEGRLTINPLAHIHPIMTIALPALLWFVLPMVLGTPPMIFGGAKPVPVVESNLKSPARDMMLVAIAGPISNLVLAVVGLGALRVMELNGLVLENTVITKQPLATQMVMEFVTFNVLLTAFNLLPIPPLDGSRVASYVLPPLRPVFRALEFWGLFLVFAAVFLIPGFQEGLFLRMGDLYAALEQGVQWVSDRAGY